MEKKVGCIGCGVMGGALMSAVCKIEHTEVHISDVDLSKAEQFAAANKAIAEKNNKNVLQNSEYVFLAVKPNYLASVLDEICAVLSKEELISKVFVYHYFLDRIIGDYSFSDSQFHDASQKNFCILDGARLNLMCFKQIIQEVLDH